MAARIVCHHPLGDLYTQQHKTTDDCRRAIERIEATPRTSGGCDGPHIIQVWADGAWRKEGE